MLYSRLLEDEKKDPSELKEDYENLEFQLFRMQENMKEIAKKFQIIGIDQTKDEDWVIVYTYDDGRSCRVMLDDCNYAYQGTWDFSIQAKYVKKSNTIHIGDIKGPEDKGYGSIALNHLKELAMKKNIQYITGDLAERDWDHLDRLIHFYKKHQFDIDIEYDNKCGVIKWNPQYQYA